MNAIVKLTDLTDALDMIPGESAAWLDRQTGEVLIIESEVVGALEECEGDEIPEGLEEWQENQLPAARGIVKSDPRYLALPDKFEFDEYRYMERFVGTVSDVRIADQLWRAIKGKGAFRHFKDTAHRLGLIDEWYRYREDATNEFMLRWAEVNQIAVDKTPRGPVRP